MGGLNETLSFDKLYQQDISQHYKFLSGEDETEAVLHEFYSNDGLECIKIEFLLGSSHNCMIEIILSECIIDSYKRISYYSSLEEKYDGSGSPNGT